MVVKGVLRPLKKIIVDIMSDGEVRIETRGFKGPACLEETEFLKAVLGKETASQLTACYREKAKQPIKQFVPLCG